MALDEPVEKSGKAKRGKGWKLALEIVVVISAFAALTLLVIQLQTRPRLKLSLARAPRIDGSLLLPLPWGGSYPYYGDSVLFNGAYRGMETNEDRQLPRPKKLTPVKHQP